MPSIILTDLASAKPVADCWPCLQLRRSIIPLVVNGWLFCSSAQNRGWCPIALDPAFKPRLGQLSVLARCIWSLASNRVLLMLAVPLDAVPLDASGLAIGFS